VGANLAVEEKEVAALRRLGLTEYEARIYLAIIKMGPKKASEISFFGQVPRTKTYGSIRELERKGLLRIIPGKPELYAPTAPSETLLPLVSKLNREVKDSEDTVQSLAVLYESSKYTRRYAIPKDSSEFWRIDGRRDILRKLNEIMHDATKWINYSTSLWGLVRAYKAHSEVLEEAKSRGVAVRLLSPISSDNSAVAKEFSEIVELRQINKPFRAGSVSVDSGELVVIDSKPDDLKTDRGFDLAIWTTNKLIVEVHDELFERMWNTLPLFKAASGKEAASGTSAES
jgi:sugar-specific transcriptional regulator TrmB